MRKILSLFIFTILITSCHQKQTDKASYAVADISEEIVPITRQSPNEPPPQVDQIEKQEVIKKKIIKDGRLGLRVSELENTKLRVDTLVKKYVGYYANESLNNSDWESSYVLKIRIPGANFEKFISDIETGDGEIIYKEIDARDVTDQFIDLETRLENKRNYLKRYNDLLNKANSVKEILEIEEKIRGLEEEIESTTGRLKYLSDQVDYSTLDLNISKQKDFKYNPAKRDKFSERLKQSLSKGWFGFVDFLLFIIKIWPFWIMVTLILYFWRKYKMTKKNK
ncbi:MAG: DUF4349 domain-containing protein [Bacteroidales bacterium]|nr:DUF4349 domain-containing protein [Bacteroidales bacterium]